MAHPFSRPRLGLRRLARDARATVAIEFALLMPLLFALLFAMVAFGLDYAVRIALTHAAAEGGRAALAGLDDGERESLARAAVKGSLEALSPLVDPENATVAVAFGAADGGREWVTVRITYRDGRFANMPFLPRMTDLAPVSVRYLVTDPQGEGVAE